MEEADETKFPQVAIIQALETQCSAWNEGGIKRYMEGYAEDAIYISQSLKTVAKSTGKESDICLHGRRAIEEVFLDVLMRSQKRHGYLLYRQIQVQHATANRAFVMGRYTFSLSVEKQKVDEGVFTLDMAREIVSTEGNDISQQWKIKSEHSSSSLHH